MVKSLFSTVSAFKIENYDFLEDRIADIGLSSLRNIIETFISMDKFDHYSLRLFRNILEINQSNIPFLKLYSSLAYSQELLLAIKNDKNVLAEFDLIVKLFKSDDSIYSISRLNSLVGLSR